MSRSLDDFDLRELSQRDERAGRRRNKNLPDRLDIVARGFGKTHGKSEDLQTLIDGARLLAADGGLDNFVNVSDVDAVAGDFFPVDFDLEIGEAADFFDVDVGGSAHFGEHGGHGVGLPRQHIKVIAENLDADGGFYAANQFVHSHRDGLRETRAHAGNVVERVPHFADQFFVSPRSSPFFARLEGNDAVALVDAIGIGGDLGASGLGNHVDDFGKSPDDFFGFGLDFQRLGKRDAGQPVCADRDGSFIEGGKKFRANKRHEGGCSGQGKRGGNDNQHGMAHAGFQQPEICVL